MSYQRLRAFLSTLWGATPVSSASIGLKSRNMSAHLTAAAPARATLRSCGPVPVPAATAPSTKTSTRMGMPPTRLVHLFSCATVTWISISAWTPPVGSLESAAITALVARRNHREGLGSIHASKSEDFRPCRQLICTLAVRCARLLHLQREARLGLPRASASWYPSQAAFEARASSTWKTARIIRPLLHLSTRLAGRRGLLLRERMPRL
jgi:hypothetical protein